MGSPAIIFSPPQNSFWALLLHGRPPEAIAASSLSFIVWILSRSLSLSCILVSYFMPRSLQAENWNYSLLKVGCGCCLDSVSSWLLSSGATWAAGVPQVSMVSLACPCLSGQLLRLCLRVLLCCTSAGLVVLFPIGWPLSLCLSLSLLAWVGQGHQVGSASSFLGMQLTVRPWTSVPSPCVGLKRSQLHFATHPGSLRTHSSLRRVRGALPECKCRASGSVA